MKTLTLTRPDDAHLHLRDQDALKHVIADSARVFGRAVIMPFVHLFTTFSEFLQLQIPSDFDNFRAYYNTFPPLAQAVRGWYSKR